jgi:hypothetical protein
LPVRASWKFSSVSVVGMSFSISVRAPVRIPLGV